MRTEKPRRQAQSCCKPHRARSVCAGCEVYEKDAEVLLRLLCVLVTPSDSDQVIAQLAATAGMAQAVQRLVLDLADALAGQAELLPHLFQRVAAAVVQAKAQAQDARLARRQGGQDVVQLVLQQVLVGRVRRRGRVFVRDKASQFAVLFLAHRLFQRQRAAERP